MKFFFEKHHRTLFYFTWLLLGLFQSVFTELLDDEAYYWVYSKYISWGYFDHPPMIALLVKAGYALFQNELGVRLVPLLMNLSSLWIIEILITEKKVRLPVKGAVLFYSIALSLAVFQISGFIAAPDIPLIFFTALFFVCYRQFLNNASFLNVVLLGIVMALLVYSKYHGVLIVFFVLLSNIRLLSRYQIYVAGIVALICFIPHIFWQWNHNWVSLHYHLFESNVSPYKIAYTLEYIAGQFLLAGPIAGLILLPAAFIYHPKNALEKALYFTLVGIYVFFLLSSLRGKVEANWTSPVIVPLIILSYHSLNAKRKWRLMFYKTLPFSILLVLFFRLVMIADIIPVKAIRQRYHAWKKWPWEMKEKTKALPVVFRNSYQRASKYWFYTGQISYSQNFYKERRNNYNFWPIEDSLLGKKVYVLDIHELYRFRDSLKTPIGWVGYKYDSSFSSFAKIEIECVQKKIKIKRGDFFILNGIAKMDQHYDNYISAHPDLQTTVVIGVFNKNKWVKDLHIPLGIQDLSRRYFELNLRPQLSKGQYQLRFAIGSDETRTHNSRNIALVIE